NSAATRAIALASRVRKRSSRARSGRAAQRDLNRSDHRDTVTGVRNVDRKTYSAKAADFEQRNWFVVDAEGVTLGRLATTVAATLRGKHKPSYTPHVDTGDFVVVINADKVRVTGNKETQKNYYRHSMYPGGLTTTSLKDMRAKFPERIIESAVRGMLPGSN